MAIVKGIMRLKMCKLHPALFHDIHKMEYKPAENRVGDFAAYREVVDDQGTRKVRTIKMVRLSNRLVIRRL